MTRKKPSRRSNSRLTKADMQALTMLDPLMEVDRRIEQKWEALIKTLGDEHCGQMEERHQ
jgi:hypothetical protein